METVVRVIFVYVFVWGCFRILGKRALSQMSPFELVTLLFIPQLFSRALTRQDYSMTNAVIGAATLFLLAFATSALRYRSRRVGAIVEAQPTVLVRHGLMLETSLQRERVPPEDILAAMHKVGLERLEQVAWAILEGDGEIAVIPSTGVRGDDRERPGAVSQTDPGDTAPAEH